MCSIEKIKNKELAFDGIISRNNNFLTIKNDLSEKIIHLEEQLEAGTTKKMNGNKMHIDAAIVNRHNEKKEINDNMKDLMSHSREGSKIETKPRRRSELFWGDDETISIYTLEENGNKENMSNGIGNVYENFVTRDRFLATARNIEDVPTILRRASVHQECDARRPWRKHEEINNELDTVSVSNNSVAVNNFFYPDEPVNLSNDTNSLKGNSVKESEDEIELAQRGLMVYELISKRKNNYFRKREFDQIISDLKIKVSEDSDPDLFWLKEMYRLDDLSSTMSCSTTSVSSKKKTEDDDGSVHSNASSMKSAFALPVVANNKGWGKIRLSVESQYHNDLNDPTNAANEASNTTTQENSKSSVMEKATTKSTPENTPEPINQQKNDAVFSYDDEDSVEDEADLKTQKVSQVTVPNNEENVDNNNKPFVRESLTSKVLRKKRSLMFSLLSVVLVAISVFVLIFLVDFGDTDELEGNNTKTLYDTEIDDIISEDFGDIEEEQNDSENIWTENFVDSGMSTSSASVALSSDGEWFVYNIDGTLKLQKLGSQINYTAGQVFNDTYVYISGDYSTIVCASPYFNNSSGNVTILDFFPDEMYLNEYRELIGSIQDIHLGSSISLSKKGSRIAIGIPKFDNDGINTGKVTVLSKHGRVGNVIYGSSPHFHLGNAVSFSEDGSILAVASFNATIQLQQNAGQVIVYKYNPITKLWEILGNPLNGTQYSYFGTSVSISADGSLLVVGASGFNQNSGQCHIFHFINNSWQSVNYTIQGTKPNQRLGSHIALSGDGLRLIVSGENLLQVYQLLYSNYDQTMNKENIIITDIATTYDGNRFAIGTHNGSVIVYRHFQEHVMRRFRKRKHFHD